MEPLQAVEMVSIILAVAAAAVAAWQTLRGRTTRQRYREKCAARGRYLMETVRELARSTSEARRIRDQYIDDLMTSRLQAIRPLRELSDHIQVIHSAGNQLVRFCERINDEHREEFGSPIFGDIKREFGRNDDFLFSPTQPSLEKRTAIIGWTGAPPETKVSS